MKKFDNILGGIGYTSFSQIKLDNSSDESKMSGYNVNTSALYSLFATSIGSPVVGGGLNYARVSGTDSNDSDNLEQTLSTMTLVANAGFKFVPAEKFAIFTLGNLGYGFYNDLDIKIKSKIYPSANINTESTVKNHFLYGVSVIGTYEVAQNFSVGAGFTYDRHAMNNDYKIKVQNVPYKDGTSKIDFNEISANLVASYSL